MKVSSNARLWMSLMLGGVISAGMLAALLLGPEHRSASNRPAAESVPPPVPESAESSQLNATASDARFVGIAACAECHPEQYDSYRQTAHSRALADLDPGAEPPDAEFRHDLSGHSYSVFRRDGRLWHREALLDADASEVVSEEHPLRYLIGSGRHTRSYLVEDDGFLVESPITWYASRQAWGMSPGYDRPVHPGFERATDAGCLVCHVGRVEPVGGSFHRLAILEQSIGCESCHGPGSLHAAERERTGVEAGAAFDSTIVNPAKLPRDRLESICAQCHMRGDATAVVRGRGVTDFRPGLRLTDFRIDYFVKSGDSAMKVVGHLEQMRLSRCYQGSETLTCITCHGPHSPPAPEMALQTYRRRCLECHGEEGCRERPAVREATEPADNCMQCHMPRGPTDIPHVSFTHHRIGLHGSDESPGDAPPAIGEPVSFDDLSHLAPVDRDRCLGLAYIELSEKQTEQAAWAEYRRRGRQLIERVYRRGVRDADVLAALAMFAWEEERPEAADLARQILRMNDAGPRPRGNALAILSDVQMQRGDFRQAADGFAELTALRRYSEDWLRLGICQVRIGRPDEGLNSLLRAAEISPSRAEIHATIAAASRELGDFQRAAAHAATAARIERARRRADGGSVGVPRNEN